MEQYKEKVLVILGPTATGKSHCAIEIAKKFNGEIISGDSMLVYREMNIGTAKPSAEELAAVPHHLVDILPPEASFSVVDFKEQAQRLITEINARGHLPIIAGGTGLYIKALLEDYAFNSVSENSELREQLTREAELQGAEALHARLAALDAVAAERIHPNNVRRVVRALEVYQLTGIPFSRQPSLEKEAPFRYRVAALTMDRAILYQRIEHRVDQMMAQGLLAEVQTLMRSGISPDCQAMKAIGYKELVPVVRGETPLDAAVSQLKQNTRHYAKRQLTWMRGEEDVFWADSLQPESFGLLDEYFTKGEEA